MARGKVSKYMNVSRYRKSVVSNGRGKERRRNRRRMRIMERVEKGKREIRGQEKEGGWRKAREVGGRRGKGEEKGHGQELTGNPLPAW